MHLSVFNDPLNSQEKKKRKTKQQQRDSEEKSKIGMHGSKFKGNRVARISPFFWTINTSFFYGKDYFQSLR